MPRHVGHVTVKVLRQPSQQTGLGLVQVHRGHANLGESQLLAPSLQIRQQTLLIDGHVFL
jgi:hypothetical protein